MVGVAFILPVATHGHESSNSIIIICAAGQQAVPAALSPPWLCLLFDDRVLIIYDYCYDYDYNHHHMPRPAV